MSTAVAKVDDLTPERVALLKRTLCPDLSNDEMELLAGVAKRTGLDPFAKQIYGIKRKGKLTIQTGIDGFRVIAARTNELDGQEGPFWCGDDGVWKDVWVAKTLPVAAKVIVYRKGCRFGFVGIARFTEYAQSYNGQLADMWARMPANQIAKCAEALALRKAFPADLSGLYTSEEMEQAGEPDAPAKPVEVKQLPAKPAEQPKPEPAKQSAPALPANGEELHRRLREYDVKLAQQKVCKAGQLLAHVTQAGIRAGYAANISEWSGPALPFAVEAVKEFEQQARQKPAEGNPLGDAKPKKGAIQGQDAIAR